jgi:hypothetical protein
MPTASTVHLLTEYALWQGHLRRLVYLVIKEVKIDPDQSLIVVSPLSKDMTGKTDMFRANSIRVLAKVMDVRSFALYMSLPFLALSSYVSRSYWCPS